MKRWYKPGTMRIVFLAPVYLYASSNGGCATTKPTVLAAEEITKTLSGNTVKAVDQEVYAFVGADGSLKGLNVASGATAGTWRVTTNDLVCASWNTAQGPVENCAQLSYLGKNVYAWGDKQLNVVKGNAKNL